MCEVIDDKIGSDILSSLKPINGWKVIMLNKVRNCHVLYMRRFVHQFSSYLEAYDIISSRIFNVLIGAMNSWPNILL